jgi:hypothetical protein
MTAENTTVPSVTASALADDHADIKELVTLTAACVDAYREFYGKGVKNASSKARKALQNIRVKTAVMRKQVQTDRAAIK